MKTRLILSSSLVAAVLSAVGMLAAFAQNASPRSTDEAADDAVPRAADRKDGPIQPVILAAFSDSSPAAQDPLGWLQVGPRLERTAPPAAASEADVEPRAAVDPGVTMDTTALSGGRSPEPVSDVLRLPPVEDAAGTPALENPLDLAPRGQTLTVETPDVDTPPVEKAPIDPPTAATPWAEARGPEAATLIEQPHAARQRPKVPWSLMPRVETPRVVNDPVVATPYVTDSVILNPYFDGPEPAQPAAETMLPEQPVVVHLAPGQSSTQDALPEPAAPQKSLADRPAATPPWSDAPSQPDADLIAPREDAHPAEPVETTQPRVEQPSPRVTSQHRVRQDVARRRARAVSAVVSRAGELTRNGFRLAQRRAFYSARTEFIRALEVVAEALDADRNTKGHSQALAAGLRALEEVDDFLPRGTATGGEIQVARIAAGHQTPVLHEDADDVLPVRARQKYYSYAQHQLAQAVGSVPAGSQALYGLGKLYSEIQDEPSPLIPDPGPKMMALQQAALMVDPQNWRAANELGVLLARLQRLEEARGWLEHSVAISRQQESWHNLQVVLAQLNEQQLAQHAGRQAAQLARAKRSEVASRVEWLKPREFSRLPVDEPGVRRSAPGAQPSRTAEAPAAGEDRVFQWLPWK